MTKKVSKGVPFDEDLHLGDLPNDTDQVRAASAEELIVSKDIKDYPISDYEMMGTESDNEAVYLKAKEIEMRAPKEDVTVGEGDRFFSLFHEKQPWRKLALSRDLVSGDMFVAHGMEVAGRGVLIKMMERSVMGEGNRTGMSMSITSQWIPLAKLCTYPDDNDLYYIL